jgi:hypothetical protein
MREDRSCLVAKLGFVWETALYQGTASAVPQKNQYDVCHPERGVRLTLPTRFCRGSGGRGVEGPAVLSDTKLAPLEQTAGPSTPRFARRSG